MADDLLQAQFPAEGLSSRLLPSMKSHARALSTNVNLQIPARNAAPLVSPLPPWFKVETYEYMCTDFLPTSVSSQTNQNVFKMYLELIDTNYSGYTHIFTDGSCIVEPTCCASAAVKEPSKEIECVPCSFPQEEKHEDSEGELELRRSTKNRAAPDRSGGWVKV
ncbi:hypothetical protein FHG87_012442 [Trinorchestia longiramus]|nr:hypothetical protein FHG87_012442 [Trinorchestia longiramus]